MDADPYYGEHRLPQLLAQRRRKPRKPNYPLKPNYVWFPQPYRHWGKVAKRIADERGRP